MFTKALAPLVVLLSISNASPSPVHLNSRQFDLPYYLKPTAKAPGTAVHGAVLNAADGGLFIGKGTTTDCPGDIYPCDTFSNITAITIFNEAATASMDVYVPGGQIAYINADGTFGYTVAHTQNVPPTATQKGLTRIERFEPTETYAAVTYKGSSWEACPVSGSTGVYQVGTAKGTTGCIGFEMAAIEVGNSYPQAYEYVAPAPVS